jgi:hypothetical protein
MLQGIGICVRINPRVVHYQNILHAVAKYLVPNPVMTAIHICANNQMPLNEPCPSPRGMEEFWPSSLPW